MGLRNNIHQYLYPAYLAHSYISYVDSGNNETAVSVFQGLHGGMPIPADFSTNNCSIVIYKDNTSIMDELYFLDMIQASLQYTAQVQHQEMEPCSIRFENRLGAPGSNTTKMESPSCIYGAFSLNQEEKVFLRSLPDDQMRRIGFLELSDEYPKFQDDPREHHAVNWSRTSGHEDIMRRAAFVYHAYWRNDLDQNWHYLAEDNYVPPEEDEHNMIWWPLGYSKNFLALPVMHGDISKRKFFYYFIGNVKLKPGGVCSTPFRRDLEYAMTRHPLWQEEWFRSIGRFETTKKHGEGLPPIDYSLEMYQAVFVMCPKGRNSEQFRIWETMEVGAIPVILKRWLGNETSESHLSYHHKIGLTEDWIKLESWEEFPDFLNRTYHRPDRDQYLREKAAKIRTAYTSVKARLLTHFGNNMRAIMAH